MTEGVNGSRVRCKDCGRFGHPLHAACVDCGGSLLVVQDDSGGDT
jgi:uncharacterized OB-fold protein